MIPNQATLQGRKAILANIRNSFAAGVRGLKFETTDVQHCCATAIELGKATYYGSDGSQIAQAKYMVVWKALGDGQYRRQKAILSEL